MPVGLVEAAYAVAPESLTAVAGTGSGAASVEAVRVPADTPESGLVRLADVDVPGDRIHARLAVDFEAMRAETRAAVGVDFLGTLADLWRPLGYSGSSFFSWHKMGRAFDTQMELRGPGGRRDTVLVREEVRGRTYWRMFLRAGPAGRERRRAAGRGRLDVHRGRRRPRVRGRRRPARRQCSERLLGRLHVDRSAVRLEQNPVGHARRLGLAGQLDRNRLLALRAPRRAAVVRSRPPGLSGRRTGCRTPRRTTTGARGIVLAIVATRVPKRLAQRGVRPRDRSRTKGAARRVRAIGQKPTCAARRVRSPVGDLRRRPQRPRDRVVQCKFAVTVHA